MKKTLLITVILGAVALAGCGKNQPVTENNQANEGEINSTQYVEYTEVQEKGLVDKIKSVNLGAVVQQSANYGTKMLKVELPVEPDEMDKAEEFIDDVEEIVEDCRLDKNTEFGYFYFCTSENGVVQAAISFKNQDGKFAVDTINGIGDAYKNIKDVAERESRIFR